MMKEYLTRQMDADAIAWDGGTFGEWGGGCRPIVGFAHQTANRGDSKYLLPILTPLQNT